MTLRHLISKELRQRSAGAVLSVVGIALGVAALVAVRHVTVASERQVSSQLEHLGANIMVLPKTASLRDYYAADEQLQTLPEEYAAKILMAGLDGVEKLSPRLCAPAELNGQSVILTGIRPQSEFQANVAWQSVAVFNTKRGGCQRANCAANRSDDNPGTLATARIVGELEDHELIVGSDVAASHGLRPGQKVDLLGERFEVRSVLAAAGSIDDSRVFAHLHTVQRLAQVGEVVTAIEVLACCEDAAGDLVTELGRLLPDTKVVTISHIVQTQVEVNRLMARLSVVIVIVLTLVGASIIAGTIAANVRERRREIGTLVALGASPWFLSRLFLGKAMFLGLVASTAGAVLGLAVAFVFSAASSAPITPLPGLLLGVPLLAVVLSALAAYWPARTASRLDPCLCFREV